MNKLFIFQESEDWCNYYITFAEDKDLAKIKVMNMVRTAIEKYPDTHFDRQLLEIESDQWIVKEVEKDVFGGEWC